MSLLHSLISAGVEAAGLLNVSKAAGSGLNVTQYFEQVGSRSVDTPGRPSEQVTPVFACVKCNAEALAGLPMMVSTADDEVVESGPLVELVEQPHPNQTRRQFWRQTSGYIDLLGRSPWQIEMVGRRVVSIEAVCPLVISPAIDRGSGQLTGWWRQHPGGRRELLAPEQIHMVIDAKWEDPSDAWSGLSPRTAVAAAINQYYKADVANEASLDNGVEPGGALQTDKEFTEEQKASLTERINQRRGVRQRKRFLLLDGGLKWEQIASAYKDMEFSELKKMARTDICAGFGVPPAVVGYYEDSNYAHADAAERVYWTRTILPRAAWLAEEFDRAVTRRAELDKSLKAVGARKRAMDDDEQLAAGRRGRAKAAARGGQRYYTWFDASSIPAVQRARLDGVEQAEKWNKLGVPLNDLIRATDAPFKEPDWGKTWYKEIGKVDVQAEDHTADDLPPPPESDQPAGPTETTPDDDAKPGTKAPASTVYKSVPESQLAAIAEQAWMSWSPLRSAAASAWRRHVADLERDVLSRLESLPEAKQFVRRVDSLEQFESLVRGPGLGDSSDPTVSLLVGFDDEGNPIFGEPEAIKTHKSLIGRVLFDLVEANRKLIARVGPLVRGAFRLGGEQAMTEHAQATGQEEPTPFAIEDPQVQRLMRARDLAITDLNRRVRRELAAELADAVEAQETIPQIAERVRSRFGLESSRANTIARTEIGRSVEEARQQGRNQAGVPLKSWLHSRRETGRSWHARTERETMAAPIPNDASFVVAETGNRCPHPRATGVAKDDINCGCTTLARYPNDGFKGVLTRYRAKGFLTYADLLHRTTTSTTKEAA